MLKYAMVIDESTLKYPDVDLKKENKYNYSNNPEMLKADGFLPMEDKESPQDGGIYKPRYFVQDDMIKVDFVEVKSALEVAKENKRMEIQSRRATARATEAVEYGGDKFDISETTQNIVTGYIILLSLEPDNTKIIRSNSNQNYFFNYNQFLELGKLIEARVNAIYKKSWDLKELINRASSIEEVNLVSWETEIEEQA